MKRLVALVALSLASCRAEMTTIGTAGVTGGVWSVVDSPGDFRHYRALWVDAQNRPYTIGVPILPPDDAGVDSPPVEAALDTPEPVDAAVDASMPETLTFDVGMPSMEFPIRSVLLRRDDTGWTDVGDLPMVANAVWAAAPGVACAAGTDSFACTPGFALEQPKEWADFTAIWAASVDHVWFGGTSIVEKTDGMHIETALAPADRILSMWGSSVSDLWAVSEASVIRHWDGAEWSAQSSGVELSLRAVWGTGANDVWTVGDGGTVLHFDGKAWSSIASGTDADLGGVWGSSSYDVWIVGSGGTILHWNGAALDAFPSPTKENLTAVRAPSANVAWAIGPRVVLRFAR